MFKPVRALTLTALVFFADLPATYADQFRVLNAGVEALQARIDLIQQARTSIDLSYYRWGDDLISLQVLGLLRDASEKRNVRVRIIVDEGTNEIPTATRLSLAKSGVVIKDYLPFHLLKPQTWAHGMHNKLMIVDGATLLMGGRNIVGGYFSPPPADRFIDRDVMIRGDAVAKASSYFDRLWKSRYVRVQFGRMKGQSVARAEQRIGDALDELRNDSTFRLDTSTDWFAEVPESSAVTFLHDDLNPRKIRKPVRNELYRLIENATESVVIEVGYLMATRPLMELLSAAVRRGVRVRILTNSMRSNDVAFAQAGHLARRKNLVRRGVEVWEYMSDATLHMKSMVIDGRIAVIGSYNFDPVSDSVNTETVSYVEDETIAGEVLEMMDENLKLAARIDRHGRPEGYQRRFPGVPWSQVARTQLLRYLMVPIFRAVL